jgi:hypothetical protein
VKDDVLEKTQNVIGLEDRAISKVANLVETPAWHVVPEMFNEQITR